MGHAVNVTTVSFEDEVLQASYEKPVLVDFFATWCGPCQMLKPILERLVQEYDFVLAKVDIDQNPDLANVYRVEGVPDVRVVQQGEVKPGFVGVLPEPQMRALLASLGLKSDLEAGIEALRQAIASNDAETATAQFNALMERYPQDHSLRIEAAKFQIGQGNVEEASTLLGGVPEGDRMYGPQARTLKGLLQFQKIRQEVTPETEMDKVYVQAAQAALQQDYETALQLFLELITRDRNYRGDAPRQALLTIFGLLGDDHPLTRHYRKQLMLTLY